MLLIILVFKKILASIKRKSEDFDYSHREIKRMCVNTSDDYEVADFLVSLSETPVVFERCNHNNSLKSQISFSVDDSNLPKTVLDEYLSDSDDQTIVKNPNSSIVKKNTKSMKTGNLIPKTVLDQNEFDSENELFDDKTSILSIKPLDLTVAENHRKKLQNEIKIYEQENQGKLNISYFERKFNFHVWENIDLYELKNNFQNKFYFSFDYLFIFLYRSSRIKFTDLKNNYDISDHELYRFIVDRIYDLINNPFEITDLTFKNLNEIKTLELLVKVHYDKLQMCTISFLSILNPRSKRLYKFLYIYIDAIFKNKSKKYRNLYMEELIKYALNDYFSHHDKSSFKIIFPEFEIFLTLLKLKLDLSYLKRLFYCTAIFHLKFCFFKKIIYNEIESEVMKNGKVDIFNCKYFSYFIISSKMLFQVFWVKFIYEDFFNSRTIIFSNLVFYLQMNNKKLKEKINLD